MSATPAISAQFPESAPKRVASSEFSLCHFTVAHTQLKSRSYHRVCVPLATDGVNLTYIGPATAPPCPRMNLVFVPRRATRFGRTLRSINVLRELLRANTNLYHFQDPELLPLGIVLKLVFRKHVVYDAYEDFPSMASESPSIPRFFRGLAALAVRVLEWIAARCCDGIITADPFTLRRLARVGKSRKLVFHNFPNLDFFPSPSPWNKTFDLVYRGGLSERAGTYVLLDAMRILSTRAAAPRLLLIAYFDNPAAEAKIRATIRDLGLASLVEIRGRIPHEQMAQALGQARIGVCPLQPTAKFRLNIPVKVFEYWACGLPVVASDLPPIRPYLHTACAGLLFRSGSADELARSISWLLDRPAARLAMGSNGRSAVIAHFNNRAEIHKLKRLFASIASSSNHGSRRQTQPCLNPL